MTPKHGSIDKIKVVFIDCLRLFTNNKREDHARVEDMLRELGWLSINQLCAETRLLEAWKTVHVENYCLEDTLKLKRRPKTQYMSTRSTAHTLLETGQRDRFSNGSFVHKTALIWNTAPKNVRQATNLCQAKTLIRTFVKTLPI